MQIVPRTAATALSNSKITHASVSDELMVAAAAAPEEVSASTAAASVPGATASAPELQRGLRNWDPSLNSELANAQQTLDFLNQNASRLQGLKVALSAKLAGQQINDAQLESQLRQFKADWSQRQARTGGTLSSQLTYSSPQPATQRFRINGLDMATLQSGARETLSLAFGGNSRSMQSVGLSSDLSPEQIVQRFNQALAPVHIRVSSDDSGALIFSTSEAGWDTVRDSLAIKGDGIRFPTGQISRVQAEPEPAAIDPTGWQTSNVESTRQSLQQVVQALNQVAQAREAVTRALTRASGRVHAAEPAATGTSAAALASNFATVTSQPDYQSFSAVVAALLGISRDRVLSLLSLA